MGWPIHWTTRRANSSEQGTQMLDRNYHTSKLMFLPDTIELGTPKPPASTKITLHTVAAKENTTEKVPVHC